MCECFSYREENFPRKIHQIEMGRKRNELEIFSLSPAQERASERACESCVCVCGWKLETFVVRIPDGSERFDLRA